MSDSRIIVCVSMNQVAHVTEQSLTCGSDFTTQGRIRVFNLCSQLLRTAEGVGTRTLESHSIAIVELAQEAAA